MSALLGGKDRFLRPVAFDDGIVNIGDMLTFVNSTSTGSTVLGAQSSVGARSFNSVVIGTTCYILDDSANNVVIGYNAGIGNVAINCVVMGVGAVGYDGYATVIGQGASGVWGSSIYGIQCTSSAPYSFVGGSNSHVALGSDASVCIGDQNNVALNSVGCVSLGPSYGGFTIGELCPGGIVIGTGHIGTITAINPGLVGAPNAISIGTGSVVADGAGQSLAMGYQAGTTGAYAIAVGSNASAGANEAVIGNSGASEGIHVFAVRGYNGGVLDTFKAIDNPAADTFGLFVTHNDGATTSSKQVKAAVAPPVGAVYLYVDP